ncbi:MAG: hypothetical protein CM15mV5_0220 [uncultured marine virus]|nr:MAG: hypothetical protein CM15mV5_0220 [uncultured marine virus]
MECTDHIHYKSMESANYSKAGDIANQTNLDSANSSGLLDSGELLHHLIYLLSTVIL